MNLSTLKNKITGLLCGSVFVSLAPACTIIDNDIGQDFSSEVTRLFTEHDQPYVDDVLGMLGPPQSLSILPGGYVFLYQHFEIKERQLGFGSDEPPGSWFKFSVADADVETDTMALKFNRENRVIASVFSSTRHDLGDASSVMLSLSMNSIVDTSRLDQDIWGANQWGLFLLQPSNITLNCQNSPDSGMNGVELRGSPTRVGQRTLEYR